MAYPVLVYFGRNDVPPAAFVALALALIALRLATLRRATERDWRLPLVTAAIGLALLATFDGLLAAKAYPVLISLAVASIFGVSLLRPSSLVERLALLRHPNLSAAGRSYCRGVTGLWTVWLLLNAAIAAGLARYGSEAVWALWTGLLSYIVMGILFVSEYLVRRLVRRRFGDV